ncbi:MAG: SPOR domain-containing protein, partial [Desulfobacterales bacterium]|nr:SPOR domain-containing protein [Desulfobacterales bacterium]
ETLQAGRKELEPIRRRGFPDAFVVKMPFALRLTPSRPGAAPPDWEKTLRAKGVLPYFAMDGRGRPDTELLVGAFETRAAAKKCAEKLKDAEFHLEITHR